MRILIKEMDEDGVNNITYLMSETNQAISATVNNKMESTKIVNKLINEKIKPFCKLNNLNYIDRISTLKYKNN
jgi:hypothetical protein